MAKKAIQKRAANDSIELRRWCIEQAARWPTESPSYPGIASGGGMYKPSVEADLIGRAKKLLEWVTA